MDDTANSKREPGFYWLTRKRDGTQFVAQFDGDEWLFINNLRTMDEGDEPDDWGDVFNDKYTVGDRIPEPSNGGSAIGEGVPIYASRDATDDVLGERGGND